MTSTQKRLGLGGLTAIVFGSMIGSGIFNIAQNMAAGAGAWAVIISWAITAAGMLMLVLVFKLLSNARPDLNAGIYQYAQEGFGNYAGFNIAWGYWLCAAFGNVAYAIMLTNTLGTFWPALLDNSWPTVAVSSILLWVMYGLALKGVHSASVINDIITVIKFGCLGLIAVLLIISFDMDVFKANFWCEYLGPTTEQIRSTMLVTLWCFIGIEGAVVMSARAKNSRDVGRAGGIGFVLAWLLYLLVSVLCYGIMSQHQMSNLDNPSVAYVLREACGDWAYYFIILSVILSLTGGWVAWTLLCAQVPYEAALAKIMPMQFARLNKRQAPSYALTVSAIIMQIFIFMVMASDSVYLTAIEITGMMVLPAYLFSGIFLWKASYHKRRLLHLHHDQNILKYRVVGIGCTLYCLWLMYAGGLDLLMCTSLFYIPGTYFYRKARKQSGVPNGRLTTKEWIFFAALCLIAIASIARLIILSH